ncbi:serine/arginine repetitive matrix protein 2 isoform X2 [Folsomia candida]|nr:serine/arginine repetitive matrix protein 2 isoform X2 [Folsomia candida]
MYNGIGLTTARGSGTNGYVQRNISAIRKTKEKVPDYHEKEDTAVRPFDPELVEHERRRQAEVRCMELRDLLEEQGLPDSEIDKKINDFRSKLLAEKKLTYQRDSSGRPVAKDSHEFSLAQEQKNTRAKDAFGIRKDFIPGQSLEGRNNMPKELQDIPDTVSTAIPVPSVSKEKSPEREKAKKRKKSHKRSKRSSSSGSSSSDEESRPKKRKKEKKKKSKKSHRHNRTDLSSKRSRKNSEAESEEIDGNRNVTRKSTPVISAPSSTCCISIASSESSSDSNHSQAKHYSESEEDVNSKYSLSVVDFSGHHKYYPSLSKTLKTNGKQLSPVEAFQRACIPLLASVIDQSSPTFHVPVNGNNTSVLNHGNHHHSDRSRSSSSDSNYSSRSHSRRLTTRHSKSRSGSREKSCSHSVASSHRSVPSRKSRSKSRDKKSKSQSRSVSSHSRSRSVSRNRSISSRSHSASSHSSKQSSSRSRSRNSSIRSTTPQSPKSDDRSRKSRSPSIPRRRGSPSFMERRRITSARKRPVKYNRKDAVDWNISSSSGSDD